MNADEKRTRKEIIKLEKQMQRSPSAVTVMSLAEKYVEVGEPHQAVAVLMEGMEVFPQYETLQVLCARFMIMYQTHEVSMAEEMIKSVLINHPDNVMAQQMMQQIHACVDTMHEVARPFGADMSELPTMKTQRVPGFRESVDAVSDGDEGDLLPFHLQLTQAYGDLHRHDLKSALAGFQQILESSPENAEAREGFRITYAAIVKAGETEEREKKVEVIRRTIRFLESMRTVVRHDRIPE